jgi:hypothetical protein
MALHITKKPVFKYINTSQCRNISRPIQMHVNKSNYLMMAQWPETYCRKRQMLGVSISFIVGMEWKKYLSRLFQVIDIGYSWQSMFLTSAHWNFKKFIPAHCNVIMKESRGTWIMLQRGSCLTEVHIFMYKILHNTYQVHLLSKTQALISMHHMYIHFYNEKYTLAQWAGIAQSV